MKNRFVLFSALFALVSSAFANGDPVAYRSALTLSRTPVAVHVPQVQLLDEQCRFVLGDGYTNVEVRYLLYNKSDSNFHRLPYGFPIDWYGEGEQRWESYDFITESIIERGWRDSYVRDVLFSLNGQSLQWRKSADTVLQASEPYIDWTVSEMLFDDVDEDDPLLVCDSAEWYYSAKRTRQLVAKYGERVLFHTPALCRRWYYVELDLPAGKVTELVVRYRVENNVKASLYESNMVFQRGLRQVNTFQYDFSPAAYWGNGKVDRFNVVIDTSNIAKVSQYGLFNIEGLDVHRVAGGYGFRTNGFDLAKAKPLKVGYYSVCRHEDLAELLNSRVSPDRYVVALSGGVKNYPVGNLSDFDLSTTTVVKPDEHGFYTITIRFKDSTFVTGLMLYNGYTKDATSWRNNSRIDSISCTVGGYVMYGEHYADNGVGNKEPVDYGWQGLTDAALHIPFSERALNYDFPWESYYKKPLFKEITIRVKSRVKGRKYDDLCVSEIVVLQ